MRCYDFPSRLSGRLFASLSGVHAILLGSCLAACAPGRSEGPSGPGSLFNRRPELPVYSHVDVNGTSQVSRRSILCLCPALRPRPNRRSLAYPTVSSMLPPRFPQRRLQRLMNFGTLSRGFGTCCLRFKNGVATTHAKLASGWLARLYREGVEPSGSLQKVSDHPSSFSGLGLAQGKFHGSPSRRRHAARARTPSNFAEDGWRRLPMAPVPPIAMIGNRHIPAGSFASKVAQP